jgi:AcrR family transcriptional regulator
MAQRSKKDHIAAAALPLFLENGFKGTSIDMVVRVSGVSKPTVYNHFPDKAALMLAVLSRWIENNKPLILPIKDPSELEKLVRSCSGASLIDYGVSLLVMFVSTRPI